MADRYEYRQRVMTEARWAEIDELVAGLHNDAAHDIEDKRQIYEALMDLLCLAPVHAPMVKP